MENMKKILIIVMLLTNLSICNAAYYRFPFGVNDKKWKQFDTPAERKAALQIPASVIDSIPTQDLLHICLDYPYNIDFFLFNNFQEGFQSIVSQFNGYRELLRRNDMVDVVLKEGHLFLDSAFVIAKRNSDDKFSYKTRFCLVRKLLDIVRLNDKLKDRQKELLEAFEKKNLKIVSEFPDLFIGNVEVPVHEGDGRSGIRSGSSLSVGDYYTSGLTTWRVEERQTPNGSSVLVGVLVNGELSNSEKVNIANQIHQTYGVEILGYPTFSYNCHGYAWHVSEGGDNVWMGLDNGTYEDIYWEDSSYVEVPESLATKVSYSGNHSAVRISGSEFVSKWGYGPLVKHSPTVTPGYGYPHKYYRRLSPSISGEPVICDSCTYTINNVPSFLTVSWSIDNSNFSLMATGNQCVVSCDLIPSYRVANLTATISRNNQNLFTVSKRIVTHSSEHYFEGYQSASNQFGYFEFVLPSGAVSFGGEEDLIQDEEIPDGEFVLNPIHGNPPLIPNEYAVSVNPGCNIRINSTSLDGMNISYSGVTPTYFTKYNTALDFALPQSTGSSYFQLVGSSTGGCNNFSLRFNITNNQLNTPIGLYINLTGNTLQLHLLNSVVITNDQGLIQYSLPEWDYTICNVLTGEMLISGHAYSDHETVNVASIPSGIYIVTATYNGNTYSKKFTKS